MHGGNSPVLGRQALAERRLGLQPRRWLALMPAAGLVLLVAVLLLLNPIQGLTETTAVESLAVERTVLDDGHIELRIRNDGRGDVRLAQVMVNDAYWQYEIDDRQLGRLDGATVELAYPWQEAVPIHLGLVTGTGTVIEHEIGNPSMTPDLDLPTAGMLGLVGLLVAPIPIALGLGWLPALRRSSGVWFDAAMAFTVGLLAFLLIDTTAEGLGSAAAGPAVLDGIGLFGVGALVVLAALGAVSRTERNPKGDGGTRLAWLVAAGIGLHNLGEGLAVGTAVSTGEVALGTALVVGFAAHNLTEGVAIAGPLRSSGSRSPTWELLRLAGLVAVAGLPVLPGLWLGGFVLPAGWAALAFGVAAGALAQVIWAVLAWLRRRQVTVTPVTAGAFGAAVLILYLTGIATG